MARGEGVHDFVTYHYVYFDGGGGYFINLLFKGRYSILDIGVPYIVSLLRYGTIKNKRIDDILCQ